MEEDKNGSKDQIKKNGTEKGTFYRIVVADSRCKRDGKCIDEIGTYDPNLEPSAYKVDEEAAKEMAGSRRTADRGSCENLQSSRNRKIITEVPARYFCKARKGDAGRYVMKELVEVIAKSLVENPDEVVVTENEKEDAVIIELKVGPSDMGKVIGRQGRIAKAIRTVVKAASSKSSKK